MGNVDSGKAQKLPLRGICEESPCPELIVDWSLGGEFMCRRTMDKCSGRLSKCPIKETAVYYGDRLDELSKKMDEELMYLRQDLNNVRKHLELRIEEKKDDTR